VRGILSVKLHQIRKLELINWMVLITKEGPQLIQDIRRQVHENKQRRTFRQQESKGRSGKWDTSSEGS
jgi:hypothetical protein